MILTLNKHSALAAIALLATIAVLPCSANDAWKKELETPKADRLAHLPMKVLWAWKRAEDLTSMDSREFAVAYLAKHIFIDGENIKWQSRNQPLKLPANTQLIVTIRIDVIRRDKPAYSAKQIEEIARQIKLASQVPHTVQIQIDFDALASERQFYIDLLKSVRKTLPDNMPISITALASWCLYDNWIRELNVDETVPMMFSLGGERDKIMRYFRQNHDFIEPRAKRSLGLSLEDTRVNELMIPIVQRRKIPCRVYVFTRTAWTEEKIQSARAMLSNL